MSRDDERKAIAGRLLPYWLTVLASLWILAFLYAYTNDPGYYAYERLVSNVAGQFDNSFMMMTVFAPTVIVSCACAFLLTNQDLPSYRLSWFQRIVSFARRHPTAPEGASAWTKFWSSLRIPGMRDAAYGRELSLRAKNQFGKGEADPNAMSVWLVFLPMMLSVFAWLPFGLEYSTSYAEEEGRNVMQASLESTSYLFGWGSIMCLVFFLIPVTRHSILLAAMGWSPIHALRIHIWFGHISFLFMLIHGIMLVPVWFLYYDYPVSQQIIPNPACWGWSWTDETYEEVQPDCYHVFANWTGLLAALFYIILYGSSINWVRRRNYKWFYILHVVFGTLTILGTLLHMYWYIAYLIPSITYYLASTFPTLIQALASRFRGGVKIRQVTLVDDSGGCMELQLEAHETAHAEIDREACQYVKLCVPKISLVWHPFDVYKSFGKADNKTVRFMFRPVGPFTKELAEHLASNERPVTLVDGFYRGASKVEQALQHDNVTIVAGGIAVTPYLTFLPALFRRFGQDEAHKTNSVVLHWVVREQGLCKFIVKNYLNSILHSARAVLNDDDKFAIHVYITGKSKVIKESSSVSATSSEPDTTKVESPSSSPLSSYVNEKVTEAEVVGVELESGSSGCLKEENAAEIVEVNQVGSAVSSSGHVLELARMFPRRYSSPVWNIPFFIAYSGATFMGFIYYYRRDMKIGHSEYRSYLNYASIVWITIYGILMYLAFGIFVEACVLAGRKYWPQPRLDDFAVSTSDKAVDGIDDDDDSGSASLDHPNVTITYHEGRPSESQLFEEARLASEPGIFMCGPTPMTSMIKREASKENSYLGLTRFCLYDEPYEM